MRADCPSIALVVHDCQIGLGQGRYVMELLRCLNRRFEFHVFANTFAANLPEGVTRHRIPALRANALLTVLSFLVSSERQVRRARCDLVHAQGLTCWSADLVTAHICNQARYRQTPASRLRDRLFPGLVVPLESAFYRAHGKRHAIAISQVVGQELHDHYGWVRPTSVIPHGIDTDRFRPPLGSEEKAALRHRYGLVLSDWVWLFVGEATKGARSVITQLPHFPRARLLVISRSGSEPFLSQAKALGVIDRVVWFGPEPEPELAYRAADLFVYPSNYDAFGMVVTEAMASGLPVIVSHHIGAAELIRHEENGWLVDYQEPEQLRVGLTWAGQHWAEAQRMGEAARRTARENTWERCADRTAEVYDLLLGRSGSKLGGDPG